MPDENITLIRGRRDEGFEWVPLQPLKFSTQSRGEHRYPTDVNVNKRFPPTIQGAGELPVV